MKNNNYITPQEEFWAGEFGKDYISRNQSPALMAAKMAMFVNILRNTEEINSVVEFGCNIGTNLVVLAQLLQDIKANAVEINEGAADIAKQRLPKANIVKGSILDYNVEEECDFAFTCGVMIHLNPEILVDVYKKLATASRKYVLIAEYYNPSPVSISYRGHEGRLFKRDFAGEFMENHPEYHLSDYGFVYRKDTSFPLDDITWFLLEK